MEAAITIGLDLAKSVFQVHGVDAGARLLFSGVCREASCFSFLQSSRVDSPDVKPPTIDPAKADMADRYAASIFIAACLVKGNSCKVMRRACTAS
jgi:hypothetical protein